MNGLVFLHWLLTCHHLGPQQWGLLLLILLSALSLFCSEPLSALPPFSGVCAPLFLSCFVSPSCMCLLLLFLALLLSVLDDRTPRRFLRRDFHLLSLHLHHLYSIQLSSLELSLLTLTDPILNHSHTPSELLDTVS